jgi:hypothetical protein
MPSSIEEFDSIPREPLDKPVVRANTNSRRATKKHATTGKKNCRDFKEFRKIAGHAQGLFSDELATVSDHSSSASTGVVGTNSKPRPKLDVRLVPQIQHGDRKGKRQASHVTEDKVAIYCHPRYGNAHVFSNCTPRLPEADRYSQIKACLAGLYFIPEGEIEDFIDSILQQEGYGNDSTSQDNGNHSQPPHDNGDNFQPEQISGPRLMVH